MKIISEISHRDFKFWSGGEDRAKNCTDEQLDKIESIMESDAPCGASVMMYSYGNDNLQLQIK